MIPEFERKKPVWLAMSDFFLDTELDDHTIEHIARVVIDSGYKIEEIEEILMNDLFPALLFNLHDVAGEWAGFPEEWLIERIEGSRNPNIAMKLYYKSHFWMVKDYWTKLLTVIEKHNLATAK
jgi:intergrase/recombinase